MCLLLCNAYETPKMFLFPGGGSKPGSASTPPWMDDPPCPRANKQTLLGVAQLSSGGVEGEVEER